MPTRATSRAQCIDFYAAEDINLTHGQTRVVDLGVRVILPSGYGLEFRERSGLATRGILVGAGIIDQDYHGNLKAVIRYLDPSGMAGLFKIRAGDKIVQAELVKTVNPLLKEIDSNEFEISCRNSERGEKGFGSSDEESK